MLVVATRIYRPRSTSQTESFGVNFRRPTARSFLDIARRDQYLVKSAMEDGNRENPALAILQEVLDHWQWVTAV